MPRAPRRRLREILAWLGLVPLAGLTVLFLLPVVWMASTSFQAGEKMYQLTTEWIPTVWHPENYPNALFRAPFLLFFLNSAVVSLAVMAGNLVFCTLAGHGLAKIRFPGDRFVLLAILSTLMLPMEVTLVPTFLIIHQFNWLDTYQGIVAPPDRPPHRPGPRAHGPAPARAGPRAGGRGRRARPRRDRVRGGRPGDRVHGRRVRPL